MAAIWHDTGAPSFLCQAPQVSFQDVAEIVAPAPVQYEQARLRFQAWERRFGAAWYQHNAQIAWEHWQRKRPWWL